MPSSYHKRQTPITKRMAEDMLVRNLAVRTIDTYTYHVDRFARHFGKLPEDLGPRTDSRVSTLVDSSQRSFLESIQSSGLRPTLPLYRHHPATLVGRHDSLRQAA